MKVFLCYRSVDIVSSEKILAELKRCSNNSLVILYQKENINNWKKQVLDKLKNSDYVVFLLGNKTTESEFILWELEQAKKLNKPVVCILLSSASEDAIKLFEYFPIFNSSKQCYEYLSKIFIDDRKLQIEQYKIMVSSTEKVTEQRLKVNNLFFTITSSILSISLVIGKALDFSIVGSLGMILLTIMALLVSFFWEKLINSYGKLNKGKFKVIDIIEKKLRTNMFENEWEILTNEIKYESNTQTETKVIHSFRGFIIILGLLEVIYLIYKLILNF